MKEITLKDNDYFQFNYFNPICGIAYFQICTQYKRGKLVKLWIYPKQQPDCKYSYVIDLGNGHCSQFDLSSYDDLSPAHVWKFSWCKDHKCIMQEMSVPSGSKYLMVSIYSFTVSLKFKKIPIGKQLRPSNI